MQVTAAALTLLAAIGLTYFFCLRPMSRGRSCGMCLPRRSREAHEGVTEARAEDLQAAWAELATVRASMAPRPGPGPAVKAQAWHGSAATTTSSVDKR